MSIQWLYEVILDRYQNPTEQSYTARLFAEGLARMAQKVGEEGVETAVAALAEDRQRLIEEIADLTYHVFVLMVAKGIRLEDITDELERRHR
ncbi:MAG: phosphoribosyl-ATP diphosphatase [Chloroflexota bacterium]